MKRSILPAPTVVEDTETKNKLKVAEEALAASKQQLEQQRRDTEAKILDLNKQMDTLRAQAADDRYIV